MYDKISIRWWCPVTHTTLSLCDSASTLLCYRPPLAADGSERGGGGHDGSDTVTSFWSSSDYRATCTFTAPLGIGTPSPSFYECARIGSRGCLVSDLGQSLLLLLLLLLFRVLISSLSPPPSLNYRTAKSGDAAAGRWPSGKLKWPLLLTLHLPLLVTLRSRLASEEVRCAVEGNTVAELGA